MATDDREGPARTLAPGTIDKVRANLGPLDPEEANLLAKKLGGDVLHERAPEPERPSTPVRRPVRSDSPRATGYSSHDISSRSSSGGSYGSSSGSSSGSSKVSNSSTPSTIRKSKNDDLPEVSPKELKLMNKVMKSPEYDLMADHGFLNFFYNMFSKNKEKLARGFGEYNLKMHVEHMQSFIGTIKTFIQIAPDQYKSKIATETDLKFKFLRTVGKWTMRDIKVLALELEENAEELTIPMLIPFVRNVYHYLLQIYYIGEQKVSATIKEIYNDLAEFPKADKKKLQNLAKQAITEWLYIYNSVIKGLYPLLMRMCSDTYVEFPRFFTAEIAHILPFVNLSKYDLLLPEKKKKEEVKPEKPKKKEPPKHIAGAKDDVVVTGLKILEQLFPGAGFNHLEQHPDMYPYFQPMYKFDDGFNMLSRENPIQVTIVLVRILEDFFQGCRNIDFNISADEKLLALGDDFNKAMSDWSFYREDLFDKKYGNYLRNYVNAMYTQSGYETSQFGKENLNNILYRAKYYFLPLLQFNAPILGKPTNDSTYRPLFARTDYMRTCLTAVVQRIDENAKTKGDVLGVLNPWNKYEFELPNLVSKRLDILLGAKRPNSNATNANLIKYTLCIISVLDWWLNNPQSPAYSCDWRKFYRVNEKDGSLEFSVPERTDQNQLFAEGIKKALTKKS